jgi:hypothetical protein
VIEVAIARARRTCSQGAGGVLEHQQRWVKRRGDRAGITVALMTGAPFAGGSAGLVIAAAAIVDALVASGSGDSSS